MFNKVLQEHIRVLKRIVVLHDSKLFVDKIDTPEDEYNCAIKIKLIDDHPNKKRDVTRWVLWFGI